jgi:ferredoxin
VLAGDAGQMTDRERKRLSHVADATNRTRLSCQVLVSGDVTVRVVNRLSQLDLEDAGPRPNDTLDAS